MNKCIGCGIPLQNTLKNELGYTPKLDNKYCERCFKTIHYSDSKKVENFDNKKIISKINQLGLFTIFITDLLNLNTLVINEYKKIINKKILVINKTDLIPDNLSIKHLKENIKNSFSLTDEIIFISAKNKLNLDTIMNLINFNQKVIFCGETSSGKSTLINALFDTSLTTSKFNNTTLDFIKIKKEDLVIYDSPGLVVKDKQNSYNNIKTFTKKLKDDYILTVDDINICGNGYITIFCNENTNIISKKNTIDLDNHILINDNSDIEFSKGFIFIKKACNLKVNKNLSVRKSIIGK